MTLVDRLVKRTFDITASFIGLLLLAPVICVAWVVASLETRSNGLFMQQRVGRYGKPFHVYKIKTMRQVDGVDTTITKASDVRITRSGRFFRKTKIDELPQLWNVLIGKMSFVGPRPDVPGYADRLRGGDRIILTMRPGITGPASLKYKDEEELLGRQEDAKTYNDTVIWPDKVRVNVDYINNWTFLADLRYIIKTIIG
jgi:lipopolysaccharide/colanic/teichoic acid biosynthesis glycosyltransferase